MGDGSNPSSLYQRLVRSLKQFETCITDLILLGTADPDGDGVNIYPSRLGIEASESMVVTSVCSRRKQG